MSIENISLFNSRGTLSLCKRHEEMLHSEIASDLSELVSSPLFLQSFVKDPSRGAHLNVQLTKKKITVQELDDNGNAIGSAITIKLKKVEQDISEEVIQKADAVYRQCLAHKSKAHAKRRHFRTPDMHHVALKTPAISLGRESFDRLVDLAKEIENTPGCYFEPDQKNRFAQLDPSIRDAIYYQTYLLCDPTGFDPWPIGQKLFDGDLSTPNATRALAIRHFLMLSLSNELATSNAAHDRFLLLPEEDRRDIATQLQYIMPSDGPSSFDSSEVPHQKRAEAISRALLRRIAEFHRERLNEAQRTFDASRARMSQDLIDQVAALQKELAQSQTEKSNLEANLKSSQATIDGLKSSLQGAQVNIDQIKAELAQVKDQVSNRNADLEAKTQKVHELETDLANRTAEAGRLQGEIANREEKLKATEEEIKNKDAAITKLELDKNALQAKAEQAENEIKAQIEKLQQTALVREAASVEKMKVLQINLDAANADAAKKTLEAQTLHEQIAKQKADLDATQAKVIEQTEQLRKANESAHVNADQLKELQENLDAEKSKAEIKKTELNAALEVERNRLEALQIKLDAANADAARKTLEAQALHEQIAKQKVDLNATQAKVIEQREQLRKANDSALVYEASARQIEVLKNNLDVANADAARKTLEAQTLYEQIAKQKADLDAIQANLNATQTKVKEQTEQLQLAQQTQLELELEAAKVATNNAEKIKLQSAHEEKVQALEAKTKELEAKLTLQQEEQRKRMKELASICEQVENPESREMQEAGHQAEQLVEQLSTIGGIKVTPAKAAIFNANRNLLELLSLIGTKEISFKKPNLFCNGRSYTPEMNVTEKTSTFDRQLLDLRQRMSTITPQQMRTTKDVFSHLVNFCKKFKSKCAIFNQTIYQFREAKCSYEKLKDFCEKEFIPLFNGMPAKSILEIKLLAKELEKQKEIYPESLIKSLDKFIVSFNKLTESLSIQS